MTARKNDRWRIEMRLSTRHGRALAAALEPEPIHVVLRDRDLDLVIEQERAVDLRARWNGAVRGLVAAEEALMTARLDGAME